MHLSFNQVTHAALVIHSVSDFFVHEQKIHEREREITDQIFSTTTGSSNQITSPHLHNLHNNIHNGQKNFITKSVPKNKKKLHHKKKVPFVHLFIEIK